MSKIDLRRFKDVKEAFKALKKRRREIEDELSSLKSKFELGEIDEEEYNRRKYELEREFVEIMDRLIQLRYIIGER